MTPVKDSASAEMLNPKQLKMDPEVQPRIDIDQALISEYAQAWKDGADFPPVVAFHEDSTYWLADGFHRTKAAIEAGIQSFPVEVHEGGKRDAILYAVGANATHGQMRSNADKRRAVETLLKDDRWGKWSHREIARRCRVTKTTVNCIAEEPSLAESASEKRQYTTKHGTEATMDTSNIGSRSGAKGAGSGATEAAEPESESPAPKHRRRGRKVALELPRDDPSATARTLASLFSPEYLRQMIRTLQRLIKETAK